MEGFYGCSNGGCREERFTDMSWCSEWLGQILRGCIYLVKVCVLKKSTLVPREQPWRAPPQAEGNGTGRGLPF